MPPPRDFEQFGTDVQSVEADLSTIDGVDTLLAAAGGRADRRAVRQCRDRHGRRVPRPGCRRRGGTSIDTNITGTVYLLQKVLDDMVARDDGKVLVTGSIAGYIPGAFNAVYNATKAFVDNFTEALRNEIKDVEGRDADHADAGRDRHRILRARRHARHQVGQDDNKADPAKVAKDGWDALMAGKGHIVSGWKNKLQVAGGRQRDPAAVSPNSIARWPSPAARTRDSWLWLCQTNVAATKRCW